MKVVREGRVVVREETGVRVVERGEWRCKRGGWR